MHPLLQNWRRFAAWVGAWIPVAAILTILVSASARLSIHESVAVTAPVRHLEGMGGYCY